VVLVAPFTSLKDMARRTVGWPLCHLLLDHYDNRARLLELRTREPMPGIDIFFGGNDDLVPASMGRELAALDSRVRSHEYKGAGHNDVLFSALRRIFDAMGD